VDLLYFTLLISILIFIHESGHFAFAKIFGVKVLTFSIGFGPKIVKIRGKETEYCIGLIPLGGFVKMLEESKRSEPILPEDRKRTFESQTLWRRVVIVLAGPAMNLLFPIVLYTSVFLEDQDFLAPLVGVVLPGKPADGKLMPGDKILSVDGISVSSFQESQRLVAARAGVPTNFVLQRDGAKVQLFITPANEQVEIEPRELDITEHVGQVGFQSRFPAPVIGVPRTDSPAYRAGLRTFDRVTALNGRKIDRFLDLVNALAANKGDTVVVAYQRPIDVPNAMGGLCDIAVLEPQVATLTPAIAMQVSGGAPTEQDRERDVLARSGIESADLYAAFVPESSSEWKAGLRAGDRVTVLDGEPQRLWSSMDAELGRGASRMHSLAWTRGGEPMAGMFQLRQEEWDDESGQRHVRYAFRTIHWLPDAPSSLVPNPSRLWFAVQRGLEETARGIKFTALTFLRLVQGRLSLSSVSGPIAIYDIAGEAGAKGTTYFVWAMALISINIGLINLLPIPVLDGGHLSFFVVEGLSRRPLSLRVREVASLLGMSLLLLLMLIAFKNDVERRWDVIVGQIREIFG
jgi:regulator of sigma E protease